MNDQPASPFAPRALPFTALRAVEAAVRHRSYSAAARELQITHAAISQAIKRLEKELDLKLFARNGQSMEPSDVALQMASAYSQATDTLYRSLDGLWQRPARAVLAIPSDLGRLWFAPRLDRLSRDLPGLMVEIRTGGTANDDVNLAVGFEPVAADGWTSERIFGIDLFPVCSPSFRAGNAITRPKDLAQMPLLAEKRWPWSIWFEGVGEKRRRLSHSLTFDDANLTLDAAVRGHGVALTHIFQAQDYLRSGALVQPLPRSVATGAALHLSWRQNGGEGVSKMANWVRSELLECATASSL